MNGDAHVPLAAMYSLQRTTPSVEGLKDVQAAVQRSLSSLQIPAAKLRGRKIAVTVGSRGIDRLAEVVRAVCLWLRSNGAVPFLVPAMGSHGGGTAAGQRAVLE